MGTTSTGTPHTPLKTSSTRGATLLETALVLLLLGLLAGLAAGSGAALLAARKIAGTRVALEQAKACLLERARLGERYPTFSDGLDCGAAQDLALDVDVCLCASVGREARDAWGGRLRFLQGLRDSGQGLAGEFFAANAPRGQSRIAPDAGSHAIDAHGRQRSGLAFVLLSLGPDAAADHASYSLFPGGLLAATLQTAPDFSSARDDLVLFVTADELAAALAR
jgi:type II secretory pathway pseudopilin PulG